MIKDGQTHHENKTQCRLLPTNAYGLPVRRSGFCGAAWGQIASRGDSQVMTCKQLPKLSKMVHCITEKCSVTWAELSIILVLTYYFIFFIICFHMQSPTFLILVIFFVCVTRMQTKPPVDKQPFAEVNAEIKTLRSMNFVNFGTWHHTP